MIYQLEILYGALINGKVIYSTATKFDDCTKYLTELNERIFKEPIINKIKKDGLNPDDFIFSFITKEQYENRIESEETVSFLFGTK